LKLLSTENKVRHTWNVFQQDLPEKAHIILVFAILIIPNKAALPWPAGLQL
jgi:hypothetical protein